MKALRAVVLMGMAVLTAVGGTALANIYIIKPDGSGTYPTIQEAVDVAEEGDDIILADGVFTGAGNRDVQVPSRLIFISSQSDDIMRCQIDCEGGPGDEHRGFLFTSDVGSGDANIDGIGIINGYVTDGGAGILVDGCSPTITDCAVLHSVVDSPSGKGGGLGVINGGAPIVNGCYFVDNSAGKGGGVAIDAAHGMYSGCVVTDNTATGSGGGVYIDADQPTTFWYCSVLSNEAPTAAGVHMLGSGLFTGCDISRNDATAGPAGGVLMEGGNVSASTLVENSATEGAGGIHCNAGTGGINQCIIAFSEGGYGVGAATGHAPSLECCDVYGNAAGEYDSVVGNQSGINFNFSEDPLFCDREAENYTLFATSPCADTNSPCGMQVGRFGVDCDDPVERANWGRVKSLYR